MSQQPQQPYYTITAGIVTSPVEVDLLCALLRGHYSGASEVPKMSEDARNYVAFTTQTGRLLRVSEDGEARS